MNKRVTYAAMIAAIVLFAEREYLSLQVPQHARGTQIATALRAGTGMATLALLGVAFIGMSRAIADRSRARRETEVVVAQLEMRICDLQQRTRDISLLADMSEMLHLSLGIGEAMDVIPSFGRRLFPMFDGALYLVETSTEVAELMTVWGADPDVVTFNTVDCWAMRRTQAHLADGAQVMCRHYRDSDAGHPAICVPMLAFGETIGVLTLRSTARTEELPNEFALVAKAFADQVSLAMANQRMQETLRTRAVRDSLTGLFNRHYLAEVLGRELQRCARAGAPVSVILIDIDWFKKFNDTFGHAGGDALLQQFARLMQHVFRDEDVVCRYGGEEFVAMLPNTPLDVAIHCANRLQEKVHSLEPHLGDQRLGNVTISAGVAAAPEHGIELDKLLSAADRALYAAKNAGRDRVVAAPTMQVVVAGRDAA